MRKCKKMGKRMRGEEKEWEQRKEMQRRREKVTVRRHGRGHGEVER